MSNLFKICKIAPINQTVMKDDYINALNERIEQLTIERIDKDATTQREIDAGIKECKGILNKINGADAGEFINNQRAEALKLFLEDIREVIDKHVVTGINGEMYASDGIIKNICKSIEPQWITDVEDLTKLLKKSGVNIKPKESQLRSLSKKLKNCNGSIAEWIMFVRTTRVPIDGTLDDVDNSSSYDLIKHDYDIIRESISPLGNIQNYDADNGPAIQEQCDNMDPILDDEYSYETYKDYIFSRSTECADDVDLKNLIELHHDNLRNNAVAQALIDKITTTYGQAKMKVVIDYCLEKNHPADFSGNGTDTLSCPNCKKKLNDDGTLTICEYCGAALFRICEECNRKSFADSDKCSCGHTLISVEEQIYMFNAKLNNGDFHAAEAILRGISEANLGKKLDEYKDRLNKVKSELPALVDEIKNLFDEGNFYTAETKYRELKNLCTKYVSADVYHNEASHHVRDAESCITRANNTSGVGRLELYMEAYSKCKDHPNVILFATNNPPQKPEEVVAKVHDNSVNVNITYSGPREGLSFYIVRKTGSTPISDTDGRLIALDNGSLHYTDSDIRSGVGYYYSAFCRRMGIPSELKSVESPVMKCEAPGDVEVFQRSKRIEIRFELPDDATSVKIIRKRGTEPSDLNDGEVVYEGPCERHVFDNDNLSMIGNTYPNEPYFYSVAAGYGRIGSDVHTFSKLSHSRPLLLVNLPEPIRNLVVNMDQEPFKAEWSGENCILYDSSTVLNLPDPILKESEFVALNLRPLPNCHNINNISKTFMLDDDRIHYIYPVITTNNYCIVGNPCRTSMLPSVSFRATPDGANCQIRLNNWPGASCLRLRVNIYTADGNPINNNPIVVARGSYEKEPQIIVSTGGMDRYKIGIVAVYGNDDESVSIEKFADVSTITPTAIYYQISKARLSKKYYLEISSNSDVVLGPFTLRAATGGTPNENSCVMLSIHKLSLKGREKKFPVDVNCNILHCNNPEFLYWGLFFDNEADRNRFQFVKKN